MDMGLGKHADRGSEKTGQALGSLDLGESLVLITQLTDRKRTVEVRVRPLRQTSGRSSSEGP